MTSPCRTFENEISVRASAEQTCIRNIHHRFEVHNMDLVYPNLATKQKTCAMRKHVQTNGQELYTPHPSPHEPKRENQKMHGQRTSRVITTFPVDSLQSSLVRVVKHEKRGTSTYLHKAICAKLAPQANMNIQGYHVAPKQSNLDL